MFFPIRSSKRLLIFILILAIFLLLAFFIFNAKLIVKAQNQIKIFPTSYNIESSGNIFWQNPQNAFTQDLQDNASFSNFNEENSAFIQGNIEEETTTTTIQEEPTTTTIPQETTTTTTLSSETTITTTLPPEETTTTINLSETTTTTTLIQGDNTTTTTNPPETTTTTEPISFLEKFFGFLIPKVNAEEENQITNFFAAIIFDDFSLPEDFDLNQIQNIQLRFSLAGKGEEGDELKISYFYDNEWQNFGELDLYSEISNNTNGGYFLYALPIFENPEDLQNLKIKFTYSPKFQIPNSKFSSVYLDSVWLEIDYEEIIQETITIKKIKHDWKMNEEPEFDLSERDNKILSFFRSLVGKKEVDAYLLTPNSRETKEGIVIQENKIKVTKLKKNSFQPGLYKLRIKQSDQISIQEFTWGVLAINANKSIYLTNETAYLQMAVLKDDGHTVCDASLKLEITNSKFQTSILSTADGTIKYSGKCGPDNVTDEPDYFTHYQLEDSGIYQMKLTNLDNGYEINDSFEVRDSVPFEIERIGPTRIYPLASYEMKMRIKSNQDFNGEIIETVPVNFDISILNTECRIQNMGQDQKSIIWNVEWKAGGIYELKYVFDAPNVSPYMYLLGPLEIGEFQEIRQWQIAADAPDAVIKVEHIEFDIGADGSTKTITNVGSLNSAFFRNNTARRTSGGPTDSTANTNWNVFSAGAQLTGVTTLTAYRASTQSVEVKMRGETWRYTGSSGGANEFIVRWRGKVTIDSGSKTGSQAISGISDRDDIIPFVQGVVADLAAVTDGNQVVSHAHIDSSDNLIVERGETGTAVDVYVVVVEFTGSNWKVGHALLESPSTGSNDITLKQSSDGTGIDFDTTDWGTAFIEASMSASTDANHALEDTWFVIEPRSGYTTDATVTFDSTAGLTGAEIFIHVLQHDDMVVTRYTKSVSIPASADNTVSGLTNLDESALEWYVLTDGTGTAYARGATTAYLTSTTNVAEWTHRTGNTGTYRYGVIDLSGITPIGPFTSQLHFRWRDDTTDLNTGGGWLAVEDLNSIGDITRNTTYRLRIESANTGAQIESAARTYELQWGDKTDQSSCADITSWTGVADASDEFDMINTTNIDPDGETTSSYLLTNSEGYTYTSGEGRDTADTTGSIGPLSASYYTEVEYSFKATDDAVTAATYCFRLYDTTADSNLNNYSVYPEVTISSVKTSTVIGEADTFSSLTDGGWSTITFNNTYNSAPVVVGTTNTRIGNNVLVFEARNITTTQADMRVCESDGQSASGCATHASETVGYLVIDAATADIVDGIEAGTFSISGGIDTGGDELGVQTVNYNESFSSAPVVFASVQTVNGTAPVEARVTVTNIGDFSAGICEQNATDDCNDSHPSETVGWVAIEPGNIPFDELADSGSETHGGGETWTSTGTFSPSFSSVPVVITKMNGVSGNQRAEISEADSVTTTSANIRFCELDGPDTCDSHNSNPVAWLAVEAGDLTSGSIALDQTTYRFYENADSVQPGSPLAAENTLITNVADNDIFRIRIAVQVGLQDLATSSQSFKLQYGEGSICSAISTSTWYDVGQAASSTIWRGNIDNTTPSDGDTITASLLNSQNNILESYEEENNSVSNPTMIAKGSRGEWDWVVENNGASGSTDYCFRMVTSDDSVIQYTNYPKLTTVTSQTPDVDNIQLNGQAAIDLIENTTKSVSAIADISDPQGCNTITNVTAKIYRSGVTNGKDCTPDNNDCYSVASCSETSCVGTDAVYTCTINMQFHADPTDESAEYWRAWIEATDGSLTGSDYSPTDAPDVNTLSALNIDLGSIDYSTVDPDNVSSVKTIEVQTTGNAAIDVKLSGTNMTWSGNTILVGQQKYSVSSGFNWETEGAALTGTATCHELSSGKPTQSPTNATENVYWKLKVPTGKSAGGPYTGSNTFDAASESSCP